MPAYLGSSQDQIGDNGHANIDVGSGRVHHASQICHLFATCSVPEEKNHMLFETFKKTLGLQLANPLENFK